MKPRARLVPYVLLGVLTLGAGLGAGLGVSEAPASHLAVTVHRVNPPSTLSAAVVIATVSPKTGLHNGQEVTITVSGFPPGKVHLSECADPVDVGPSGCGARLALQPFVDIENGSGSTTFVVTDTNVPDAPFSTVAVNRSSHVVLVVTAGQDGGMALGEVAVPLSFADPFYNNPATAAEV